ncbi:hypothetical protein BN1221_03330 [Brenneria goodwinii]|uniref:Uncharacterized protein n=1 Tax=Brenneria goodwinii TaxID=1109412 RepID=A0A0G4JY36_9GAMM|nr:hypothetical protein BN1221_03330 [Brenneria goodwinii]
MRNVLVRFPAWNGHARHGLGLSIGPTSAVYLPDCQHDFGGSSG